MCTDSVLQKWRKEEVLFMTRDVTGGDHEPVHDDDDRDDKSYTTVEGEGEGKKKNTEERKKKIRNEREGKKSEKYFTPSHFLRLKKGRILIPLPPFSSSFFPPLTPSLLSLSFIPLLPLFVHYFLLLASFLPQYLCQHCRHHVLISVLFQVNVSNSPDLSSTYLLPFSFDFSPFSFFDFPLFLSLSIFLQLHPSFPYPMF